MNLRERIVRWAVLGEGEEPDLRKADPVFSAHVALFARAHGARDPPAHLVACLATTSTDLFSTFLPRVVDDADMLLRVLGCIWGNAYGRRSLGHGPKTAVRVWLNQVSAEVLRTAPGVAEPTMATAIRMVRPRPVNAVRGEVFHRVIEETPPYPFLPEPHVRPDGDVPSWIVAISAACQRFQGEGTPWQPSRS